MPLSFPTNPDTEARELGQVAAPIDIVWPDAQMETRDTSSSPLLQPTIQALLTSRDAATRLKAVQALSYTKSPEALDLLLANCEDGVPEVQRAAAEGLAQMPEEVLFSWSMTILTKGNPRKVVRLDAALPWLRTSLEGRMLATLSDGEADSSAKTAAVYALGRMRSHRATKLLIDLAWVSEPALAVHSANALASIGDAGAATALVDLLRHSETGVRAAAVAGLARVGGPIAVKALSELIAGTDEKVTGIRRDAIVALAQFAEPSTVPALIRSMYSDVGVRPQAGAALRQITKMEFRDEPGLWSAWYQEWLMAQAEANKRPPFAPSSSGPEKPKAP